MSIKKRYSSEILKVRNEINLVRNGRVYGIGNAPPSDGYPSTRANAIEEAFDELLDLIESDAPSLRETIFKK